MIHVALPNGASIRANNWRIMVPVPLSVRGLRWLIEWEVLPQQIRLHPTGFDWFAEFSVFFEAEQNAQKLMQIAN